MTNAILRPRALAITLGLVIVASVVAMSLATTSVVPSAGAAQADYYLKLDGIDGEVSAKDHEKNIQIESWSWGLSQNTGSLGGGAGAGKLSPKPFVIKKTTDMASTELFKSCASGKHIKSAVLFASKMSADGKSQDYLKYSFFDVFCTSMDTSGAGGDRPTESLSFNYTKIQMEYLPQTSTGKTDSWKTSGWDLKMNKGL